MRALRRRRGWRQRDLAKAAGTSQDTVSRLERGLIAGMPLETISVVCDQLGARVAVEIRWQGAALDRLLDHRHTALAGVTAARLRRLGWNVEVEVSYSHFGERGSIDLLGLHYPTATLLVVEIKSEISSVEEMLRRLDAKSRLAAGIGVERFGFQARRVARLVVLPDASSARRQVAEHRALLDVALPTRGPVAREWLTRPSGALSGLLFLSANDGARRKHVSPAPRRVRVRADDNGGVPGRGVERGGRHSRHGAPASASARTVMRGSSCT